VALVAFVRARESELEPDRAPWQVEFPLDAEQLAKSLGIQPSQASAAVGHLRDAGVLLQVQTAGSFRYRLAENVFERAVAAEELDWSAIFSRLQGEAAALLVLRAFADLLPPPLTSWASVRVFALSEHTGYGSITVRKGKDTLIMAGILEEDAHPGNTSQYRFTEFARGLGPDPISLNVDVEPSRMERDAAIAAVAPLLGEPSTLTPPVSGMVPVQVAGLQLDLPPGTRVRLECMPDGRQFLRVGNHLVIGPL
jgi:DNA-binding transcriptional ArsR family regulator